MERYEGLELVMVADLLSSTCVVEKNRSMSSREKIEQNRQIDMHGNDGPTSSLGIWVNLVVGTRNCSSGSR